MAGRLPSSLLPYLLLLLLAGTCNAVYEYEIYEYMQTLDHFNYRPESYATFQQRYLVNSKYWGGSRNNSPIFVYTGEENDVVSDADYFGFIPQLASRFRGLLIYIEHRYYGNSMPFGSRDEAYQNASTLGYLSSEQALADYAHLIIDIKRNLSAQNCPVIAIGTSYGGMLASWFRLKYPHIVYGALASSAPILYFEDITPQNGYYVKVSKHFRDTSKSCYNTIRWSWFEMDKVAVRPNGLLNLAQTFNTCRPLHSSRELKDALEYTYDYAAQYDNPLDQNWAEKLCRGIDGAAEGKLVLGKIVAGFNTLLGQQCLDIYNIRPSNKPSNKLSNKSGWSWQTCTEMVMPFGRGANDTMFQEAPFIMERFIRNCEDLFGVSPRPNRITTEFGGHNIKSVLKNFASNIIFSNGLQDPYSAGGVLKNISDTVLAIYTEKGSHCLDLHTPTARDPNWLSSMRETEIKVIQGWLSVYGRSD